MNGPSCHIFSRFHRAFGQRRMSMDHLCHVSHHHVGLHRQGCFTHQIGCRSPTPRSIVDEMPTFSKQSTRASIQRSWLQSRTTIRAPRTRILRLLPYDQRPGKNAIEVQEVATKHLLPVGRKLRQVWQERPLGNDDGIGLESSATRQDRANISTGSGPEMAMCLDMKANQCFCVERKTSY
jgi:hypothetical protein